VVIPTRSRWRLLSRALTAVLEQRDVRLEVVVVDDASADETPAKLKAHGDPRLRLVRNESALGVSQARNRGVVEAGGEWVAFLDDDDLWSPWKLRVQLDAAAVAGASYVYGSAAVIDEDGRLVEVERAPDPSQVPQLLLAANVVPAGASNVMARTDLVRRVGAFDPKLSQLADWDLWLRLAAAGRAAACEEVLVAYSLHPQNMLVADTQHVFEEFHYLSAKHRKLDGVEFTRWVAYGQRRAGRRLQAARTYLRGAITYRSMGNLARAAGAVFAERLMRRRRRERSTQGLSAPDWLERYGSVRGGERA